MRSIWNAVLLALAGLVMIGMDVGPAQGQQPAPVEIPAILSLTGYLAFVGKGESQGLEVLQGVINKAGGINGRPVKFTILDSQSNPQVALQLANELIAKKAPVFIGPDGTATCKALYPLVEKSGPVMYCLSPGLTPSPNSYAFSAQVNTHAILINAMRFLKDHGWNRVALLTTTDANGQDITQGYAETLALPEFRAIQSVAAEHFSGGDLTVDAQIARIKAASPQALIAWVAGTPFGTAARSIHDSGLSVPVITISINANPVQLKNYGANVPGALYIPSNEGTVVGDTPPGPARNAQNIFFGAYKEEGLKPEAIDSIAWDAAMLITGAYRKLGPDASATGIRDWILSQNNWAGVYGIYNFTDGSQRGIGDKNALVFRWDPAKEALVPVSRPGGYR
jgi:branched-chain amino acid transport system substrate-binding protein